MDYGAVDHQTNAATEDPERCTNRRGCAATHTSAPPPTAFVHRDIKHPRGRSLKFSAIVPLSSQNEKNIGSPRATR
jgi:hypothetical protein